MDDLICDDCGKILPPEQPPTETSEEAVIFAEALRRGVDPLFLLALWREAREETVESWAEEMAIFLRDVLPDYEGNPLTTMHGPAQGRLRLTYNVLFLNYFGTRYQKLKGVTWPVSVTNHYWSLIRGGPPPLRKENDAS